MTKRHKSTQRQVDTIRQLLTEQPRQTTKQIARQTPWSVNTIGHRLRELYAEGLVCHALIGDWGQSTVWTWVHPPTIEAIDE